MPTAERQHRRAFAAGRQLLAAGGYAAMTLEAVARSRKLGIAIRGQNGVTVKSAPTLKATCPTAKAERRLSTSAMCYIVARGPHRSDGPMIRVRN